MPFCATLARLAHTPTHSHARSDYYDALRPQYGRPCLHFVQAQKSPPKRAEGKPGLPRGVELFGEFGVNLKACIDQEPDRQFMLQQTGLMDCLAHGLEKGFIGCRFDLTRTLGIGSLTRRA